MPISTPYPPPVCLPSAATLTIVEQPMKETRYRYKSESGSHGPLIGESSTPQRKTYPSVRLQNHDPGLPHRIRASLWLADREEPHVHRLTMKGRDEEDCCYVTVREDGRATFPSMSIVFQQKKTVADILYKRKRERCGGQPSPEEARRLLGEAKKEAAELNLNLVRIQFSAECCQDGVWRTLCCVYSNPVANSKAGKLKITKVNRTSGSCSGGDEVWILCEKINKKDIQIKFFEEDEETRVRTWEALASFAESDVHYQVAIIFRTPCYRDPQLQQEAKVKFQLLRKSDNEFSEPVEFTYLPSALTEDDGLVHKRRKLVSPSPCLEGSSSDPEDGETTSQAYERTPPDAPFTPGYEVPLPEGWQDIRDAFMMLDDPVMPNIMATDSKRLEASMGALSLAERMTDPTAQLEHLACVAVGWLLSLLVKQGSGAFVIKLLSQLLLLTRKRGNNILHLAVLQHRVPSILLPVLEAAGGLEDINQPNETGQEPHQREEHSQQQRSSLGEMVVPKREDLCSPSFQTHVVSLLDTYENASKLLQVLLEPDELPMVLDMLSLFEAQGLGEAIFNRFLKERTRDEVQALLEASQVRH
ncbi:nuclear factor NF-kappa-B p110 subunit isoform X2 [Ixodes scapularis]|uniref:nuclear factor NF-kappa-B p110 subunit isoform X2 n=1 Tax=Ixodes scapularis TaxID=6945 RepID=UPI001AD6CF35|nr:nuclear factor NF-kappa-B p110 subunit isoform X2 [Ixodes scapularis]